MFEKVTQNNCSFNALDTMTVVHSVRMPVLLGRVANKSNVRSLATMAHLKGSFTEVKVEDNFLAHAELKCDSIILQGQVESAKRIYLLYDDVTQHYNVIVNLTGAMAKRHVFEGTTNGVNMYKNKHTHLRSHM